jgi:hypothetical protein
MLGFHRLKFDTDFLFRDDVDPKVDITWVKGIGQPFNDKSNNDTYQKNQNQSFCLACTFHQLVSPVSAKSCLPWISEVGISKTKRKSTKIVRREKSRGIIKCTNKPS